MAYWLMDIWINTQLETLINRAVRTIFTGLLVNISTCFCGEIPGSGIAEPWVMFSDVVTKYINLKRNFYTNRTTGEPVLLIINRR